MSHHFLLIMHLLAATIWVGGHLYLSIGILPAVLRNRDASRLFRFEKSYEPVGVTALVLLVITGVWMTLQFGISWHQWLSFSSPVERVTSTKMILLLSTVLLAVSAQTRVIPQLKHNPAKLPEMALHIVAVTVIGMAMLVLGSFVRYGGI